MVKIQKNTSFFKLEQKYLIVYGIKNILLKF
jgi:hypothetical protein